MGEDQPLSRRHALWALAAVPVAVAIGAPALIGLRRKSGPRITGGFAEDDAATGHRVRDGIRSSAPRPVARRRVVVLGGGISGLAAAWRLQARGVTDVTVLELARDAGGNARWGENAVSRFPWGAHYLPVPGPEAAVVRAVCREFGVLTADGWDERALVAAPQERLFAHGRWSAGVEPTDALPAAERAEFARFEELMQTWRATGAFAVPSVMRRATMSTTARALDGMSMQAWMTAQGFRSEALRWYVEYGMRDDYGASLARASAWAGVHYFAGRDPEAGTLTWPEGNGWLVQRFLERVGRQVVTGAPVERVAFTDGAWTVDTPRARYRADAVVAALPVFMLQRLLDGAPAPPPLVERSPWVVANLTLSRRPDEPTHPPAWDNVILDSPSLGYVVATHQSLGMPTGRTVWTWYRALHELPVADARRLLRDRPWAAWRDLILADLRRAHPDIDSCVERIDILRSPHAMPRPVPGFLAVSAALRDWTPGPRFALAHSDAAGLSLFEEALERGVAAADRTADALGAGGTALAGEG